MEISTFYLLFSTPTFHLLSSIFNIIIQFYYPHDIITINPMIKKILYSISIISICVILTISVIAYGKGYRFNSSQKTINTTGILSANSAPDAASIWIDNKLNSATNGSINLVPNWYDLRISKEGYQSWEKRIRIQGEVVTKVDALLIPNNPSLRALTGSGVSAPVLSPSGAKIAYIVPVDASGSGNLKSKIGIWTFELKSGPLGGTNEPKQIYKPTEKLDWTNSRLLWSPDEKQIILTIKSKINKIDKVVYALQISLDNSSTLPLLVTSDLENIIADWELVKNQIQDQLIAPLPSKLSDFLKNAVKNIEFSPDNNKIFYLATSSASLSPIITPALIGSNPTQETRKIDPEKYYVYDIKEDKNFYITDQKKGKEVYTPQWYYDSKHLLMIENSSINIIDYDGTNKKAIYSGPFVGNIVYPWNSSGKIAILTNLNQPKALPNLYEIDLR